MFGWTLKTGGVALFAWYFLRAFAGYEAFADPVLEVNADMEISGVVKKTLKVGESGSPNFISGNNGDLYVKDQLEVDGGVSVKGSLLNVQTGGNSVGVNVTASGGIGTLMLGGDFAIQKVSSSPWEESDYAKFFSKVSGSYVEMFVLDENANETQLSSHADPRDFAPDLQGSSFGDPEVALPFSFHHTNAYIGKGAVVDLAAVVRDLEAMTGKSYTTHYDLPSASPERLLARYPWIEIPIEEAWEEYEAMVPERTTAYDYNLDEQTVYLVEVPTGGDSEVGTGILKRPLKENVRFEPETGKFLRRPTAAEIPPDSAPDLPTWIADRLASE